MAKQVKEMKPFISIFINEDEEVAVRLSPWIPCTTTSIGVCLGRAADGIAEIIREANNGDRADYERNIAQIIQVFDQVAPRDPNRNRFVIVRKDLDEN